MNSASALYRLLGDEARLRLLRLLAKERLNVTELTKVLGLAQSGVSRHLGLLKDAGLVAEERAGGFSYYRVAYDARPERVRLKPDTTETSAPAAVGSGVSRTRAGARGGIEAAAGSGVSRTRAGARGGIEAAAGSGVSRTRTDARGGIETGVVSSVSRSNAGAREPIWALLEAQFEAAAHGRTARADDARLEEVRRLRKESFEAHDERGQLVPGRSWAAWARALGHLLPPLRVADLGCGEGYLTIEAARWAKEVVAVDRSEAVLRQARALARRRGLSNITWRPGEIERVPLPDASVDVALLSQALHHAADPARALAEAARIVVPGGKVLVLELRRHDQAWVRERLGDRWLGFDDRSLRELLHRAGLAHVKLTVGARKTGDPFTVIVASGVKLGARDSALGARARKGSGS